MSDSESHKKHKSSKKDKKEKKNKEESEGSDVEVPHDFKKKVLKFLEYDSQIKDYQKQIKDIKAKKEELEEYILENLDKLDTSMIEVKGSKLFKNRTESKGPCKPEIIKDTLEEEFKDMKKVKRIMEKMEDKREIKEKISLKLTRERVPKKKAK